MQYRYQPIFVYLCATVYDSKQYVMKWFNDGFIKMISVLHMYVCNIYNEITTKSSSKLRL